MFYGINRIAAFIRFSAHLGRMDQICNNTYPPLQILASRDADLPPRRPRHPDSSRRPKRNFHHIPLKNARNSANSTYRESPKPVCLAPLESSHWVSLSQVYLYQKRHHPAVIPDSINFSLSHFYPFSPRRSPFDISVRLIKRLRL